MKRVVLIIMIRQQEKYVLKTETGDLKVKMGAGPVAQAVKCARSAAAARGSLVRIPGAHRRTAW